jgi:hypothetical protein
MLLRWRKGSFIDKLMNLLFLFLLQERSFICLLYLLIELAKVKIAVNGMLFVRLVYDWLRVSLSLLLKVEFNTLMLIMVLRLWFRVHLQKI